MFIGIEDPEVLANLNAFHDILQRNLVSRIRDNLWQRSRL